MGFYPSRLSGIKTLSNVDRMQSQALLQVFHLHYFIQYLQ